MNDHERLNQLQALVIDLADVVDKLSGNMLRLADSMNKLLDKLGAPPATTKETKQ